MYFFVFKDDSFTVGGTSEAGISLHNVYDENGNPINQDAQATVAGVSGVKYITLRVNAINKDSVPLTFSIVDASPTNFKTALNPPATNTAPAGSTASWISDLIDIQGMEGTVQNFKVIVKAESSQRKPSEKTYSVDIRIDEDPTAGFDIEIVGSAGDDPVFGEPPECTLDSHCGENMICDLATETCVPDPEAPECQIDSDCLTGLICETGSCVAPPAPDKVLFRTTDLLYKTGAVAYAYNGCGTELIAYGRTTGACTQYKCNDPTGAQLTNAPASYGSITATYVWFPDADTACVCEADDVGVNTYPRRYTTADSDASSVDKSMYTISGNMEVLCTA